MISSTFLFLIFGEIFFVLFIERQSSTFAIVRSCDGNFISRRQWGKWGRVCTANSEQRKIFTMTKTPEFSRSEEGEQNPL